MNLMADIAHIDTKLRHKQFQLEQKATGLSAKLKAASLLSMAEEHSQVQMQEEWQQELQQVEHAILRIKQGMYQQCELCGQPIDSKRLTVLPYTALCLNCAT